MPLDKAVLPRGRAVVALWAVYVVVFAVWITSCVAMTMGKRLTGFEPHDLFNGATGLLVMTSVGFGLGFNRIRARQQVTRRAE